MAASPSGDRGAPPAKRELEDLLGRASALWASLQADLSSEFGPLAERWSFSGKTRHWLLQLKQTKKQRTVLYLTPARGYFLAAFALGEKACQAARASGLPAAVLEIIDRAPRYPEGRGVRIEVRNRQDLQNVKQLATIKMAH